MESEAKNKINEVAHEPLPEELQGILIVNRSLPRGLP